MNIQSSIKDNKLVLFLSIIVLIIFARIQAYSMFGGIENVGIVITPLEYLIFLITLILLYLTCGKADPFHSELSSLSTFLTGIIVTTLLGLIFTPIDTKIHIVTVFFPILLFYITLKLTQVYEEKYILIGFMCLFAFLTFYFFKNREILYRIVFSDTQRISASYTLLFFLPFILCSPKRWIRIIAISIVSATIFLSLKRTGMISLSVGLIGYLLTWSRMTKGGKLPFWRIIIAVLVVLCFFYAFERFNDSIGNVFIDRFNDDTFSSGSGRTEIWQTTIAMIFDSNPYFLVFGHGHNAVAHYSILQRSAHNDLLEVLFDYGIIVFVLYIKVLVQLVRYAITLMKNRSEKAAPFMMSLILFILHSTFSHVVLYSGFMCIFCIFWAYVIMTEDGKYSMTHF